jgi:hypothetical protein
MFDEKTILDTLRFWSPVPLPRPSRFALQSAQKLLVAFIDLGIMMAQLRLQVVHLAGCFQAELGGDLEGSTPLGFKSFVIFSSYFKIFRIYIYIYRRYYQRFHRFPQLHDFNLWDFCITHASRSKQEWEQHWDPGTLKWIRCGVLLSQHGIIMGTT